MAKNRILCRYCISSFRKVKGANGGSGGSGGCNFAPHSRDTLTRGFLILDFELLESAKVRMWEGGKVVLKFKA